MATEIPKRLRQKKGLTEAEFAQWYRQVHPNVLRFVASRLIPPDAAKADDVSHETFLVAWRKLDEIPRNPNEALAWLLTVARNCLLYDNRMGQRNNNLNVRIAETAASFVPGPSDGVGLSLDLGTAWQHLTPEHQEAIALAVWDELSNAEAAKVLGISEVSFRKRLSRARAALNKALEAPAPQKAPTKAKSKATQMNLQLA